MGRTYINALPASARCAVEEVLLQTVAGATTELGRSAGKGAAARIAGVRLVAAGERAHERLALLVATGALATGAFQAVAAAGACFFPLIFGTVGRCAVAGFLGIAGALAGAADG